MAKFQGFVAGSYTSRSGTVASNRTVNMYPETVESGDGKNTTTLYGCPGLANFLLLPTSPIRGIWIGENRMFVAAGSHYYEVFSGGTYNDLGSIGSGTGPVQIVPNGTQIMIVANGLVYVNNGSGPVQPIYTSAQGTVSTSGTNVTNTSGDYFDNSMASTVILINGVAYTVAFVTDPYNLTLVTSAGTQTNVAFSMPNSGIVNVDGTTVRYVSGDQFSYGMAGGSINIGGSTYTVASVLNTTQLTLTTSAGGPATHGYWATVVVTASCGTFLDGYFVVATPFTKQINISKLDNGLRWDPIDYAIKEGYPDNIAMLLADHEELYIFGTQTAEVWRNTGNADFPLQRDPGAFMHLGVIAPWATSRSTLTQTVNFLGGDPQCACIAYQATGYQPKRVSTHAEEYIWSQYSTVADAESFDYELDGHSFWQINFPTAGKTWVYDRGENSWHERQFSTGGARHRARCHGYVFGHHFVGDYSTGQLYTMSNTLYDDAGTAMTCVRRAPHISNQLKRGFFAQLRLEMEQATGLTVTLSWSNDGSKSFNTPIVPTGVKISNADNTNILAQEWRRLGSGRDRVFEVVLSASSRIAIVNADLEVS